MRIIIILNLISVNLIFANSFSSSCLYEDYQYYLKDCDNSSNIISVVEACYSNLNNKLKNCINATRNSFQNRINREKNNTESLKLSVQKISSDRLYQTYNEENNSKLSKNHLMSYEINEARYIYRHYKRSINKYITNRIPLVDKMIDTHIEKYRKINKPDEFNLSVFLEDQKHLYDHTEGMSETIDEQFDFYSKSIYVLTVDVVREKYLDLMKKAFDYRKIIKEQENRIESFHLEMKNKVFPKKNITFLGTILNELELASKKYNQMKNNINKKLFDYWMSKCAQINKDSIQVCEEVL